MEEKIETTQQSVSTEMQETETKKGGMFLNTKMAIIIAVVLILAGLAFYFKGLVFAATVNGHPISRFAVISELERRSGKAALAALISQTLIEEEIGSKGIKVTDDEIDAEIKKIDEQIKGQGGTLEKALAEQNMTMGDLKKQISTTKGLEKLFAGKIEVTDADVQKYLKDSRMSLPKGEEAKYVAQLKEQMTQQKLNDEAKKLVEELQAKSKISHFVDY